MGGKREFCVCVCLSVCVCTVLYFVSHERQRTLQVRDTAILCDPMDYSPRGSSVHGDSPGKNTRVGCHALLHGTCPTQGSNPGVPYCRQILSQLSYQGSPCLCVYIFNRNLLMVYYGCGGLAINGKL